MAECNQIPPVIRELFALLPPPGDEFPLVDRLRWMRALEAVVRVLYKDDAAAIAIDEPR